MGVNIPIQHSMTGIVCSPMGISFVVICITIGDDIGYLVIQCSNTCMKNIILISSIFCINTMITS